jgi:hypothetical protein
VREPERAGIRTIPSAVFPGNRDWRDTYLIERRSEVIE